MKVLLTGGSGYLGRGTISALVRAGHEVSSLARSDASAQVVAGLGAKPVHGSLDDVDVLRSAAAESEGVIHLGQELSADTAQVDLAAATALQDGLGDRGVYVHTGGTWVYGNTNGIADEDSPQDPPRITAWRAANEQQVLARGNGVLVIPGLVYGQNAGLVEYFFAKPGRRTGSVPMIGDGSNHWALVHVEDIADLYVRALSAKPGSVYIGVGQNLPAREALSVLGQVSSLTLDQAVERMGPIAEALALDQRLTSERARRELGWQPRYVDAATILAKS